MQVHSQVDQEYHFESLMGLVSARDRQINFDRRATQRRHCGGCCFVENTQSPLLQTPRPNAGRNASINYA